MGFCEVRLNAYAHVYEARLSWGTIGIALLSSCACNVQVCIGVLVCILGSCTIVIIHTPNF